MDKRVLYKVLPAARVFKVTGINLLVDIVYWTLYTQKIISYLGQVKGKSKFKL